MFQRLTEKLWQLADADLITVTSKYERQPTTTSSTVVSNPPGVCSIGQKTFADEDLHPDHAWMWKDLRERPIWEVADRLRSQVSKGKVTVMSGDPGSGKTLGAFTF